MVRLVGDDLLQINLFHFKIFFLETKREIFDDSSWQIL